MSDPKSLWRAARNPPTDPTQLSFKGKTVLVTGANSGLGYAAAVKYAAQGASTLILGVRTREKGEQTKAAIVRATGRSPDIFVVLVVDLDSFESVKAFAARVNTAAPKLHILQLAGGVMKTAYAITEDGHEATLQDNALSPALLALLLLPKLRDTATAEGTTEPCYISFVNSVAHAEVKVADLPPTSSSQTLVGRCDDEAQFDFQKQYFLVKLVAWYAMRGVADKSRSIAPNNAVVVNATCPGLCKTNMVRDLPLGARVAMAVTYFIMGRSSEQGARTMVSATSLGPESHGKFWTNDIYPASSELLASELGESLYQKTWAEIMNILRPFVDSGAL
ncbi:hypothetical protein F4678DRAFT_484013 [Xylaria arbuscula]|nr:hypothetical protein F4678DRAFT_484013 [Xylaria arbuscula]